MAEADITRDEDKPRKKRRPKKGLPNLNNSQERRGSQESLLYKEEQKDNLKISKAKERTKARFESLLQAAAQDGLDEDADKKKRKKRTKTADAILSELKSGAPFVKERSKSEERLLNENLYKEDGTPKFQKKLETEQEWKKENLQLPLGEETENKNSGIVKKRSKKKGTQLKSRTDEADAGKENVGYDYSPIKDETLETVQLPKTKKKKKKQNTEDAGEIVERALETKRRDDGYLLSIQIHKADRLKPDVNVTHPCIRVHIVDANNGQYVKKSDRRRNVASFFENKNESIDYILPMMTQPYDFRKEKSVLPSWEEVLIYNEIYSYFLQREEGDPEVLIFFELIDFLSMSSVVRSKSQGIEQGWYKIAWAFLKVVSTNGSPNTDRKVRLQFYCPPMKIRSRNPVPGALKIFTWWQSTERIPYPSTLFVTIKGIRPPDNIGASTRSMFPIQAEMGTVTFDELHNALDGSKKRASLIADKKPIWNRLPGQANRIPNKLTLILPTGRKGCSLAKFSPNGRFLACACAGVDGYPVFVYEIPSGTLQGELSGHFGIIYDMSWSPNGKELLTASSDGTVRSWDANRFVSNAIKLYPHPSFVYTAKHHPSSHTIIVSGGYDKVVRIWSKQSDGLHGKLLREMAGHHGYINSIIFNHSGDQMLSGDSFGAICIWTCVLSGNKERRRSKGMVDEDATKSWRISETLKLEEIKNTPINSLKMHPNGRKVLVHARDAFLRMLDLRSSAVMKRYLGAINQKEHIRSTTSTCGTFVVSGSEDGIAYVWNTETGDPVYEYNDLGYTSAICDVDFHPHENMIVFCSFGSGHPVLVYIFDIEEQRRSSILAQTTRELNTSHRGTLRSSMRESGRQLSSPTIPSKAGRATSRAETLRQKMESVLDFAPAGSTTLKQTSRNGNLSETIMTWGSDFSTLLPAGTSKYAASTPMAPSQLSSTRRSHRLSDPGEITSGFNANTSTRPSRAVMETPIKGSPLTLSQLEESKRPMVSFSADASQRGNPRKRKVLAIYSYQPSRSDELEINPNDVITVLYEDNESWWFGELPDGRQGYFPTNYVMEQEEELFDKSPANEAKISSHLAVIADDGNLKIISAPEDSESEPRPATTKRKQRRRKAHRSSENVES